jgi:hypothetical protein
MAYSVVRTYVRLTLLDDANKVSRKTYGFIPPALEADQITAIEALITDFAAVSALTVPAYSLTKLIGDDTITTPTDPKAEGEMMALLLANISGQAGKRDNIAIRGPVDGIFTGVLGTSGYDVVDVADADLLAYIGLFQPASASLRFSDGEQVAAASPLVRGFRTSRADRRG